MTEPDLSLDSPEILACLECLIPISIASVSPAGVPNVTWISIVHRLDETHVGLSRQFFHKTQENFEANPHLQLLVIHPVTGQQYQINLDHESTETDGPRYDWMRTQLEALASQSGMAKVFRLLGLDVCRVTSIAAVPQDETGTPIDSVPTPPVLHERLNSFTEQVSAATDLDDLITHALTALETCFGYRHSMLLLVNGSGDRLFTVASHGYPSSGAGSEVALGEGHIGVVAQRRQPVLTPNLAKDQAYASAVRGSATRAGLGSELEREIELPGLSNVMSQLTVPILARGQLEGVLCLQSDTPNFFLKEDEHIVNVLASQIGLALALLRLAPVVDGSPWRISTPPAETPPGEVRHYESDDSIFIDDSYLIKGVAGRVLWRVLREYTERHRVDFSNREIRLDQTMELPDINDNLEARLILLRRRLEEQCGFIHIAKTGRGRFRLNVDKPLSLQESP
jgi:adenylate cyclase